MQHKCKKERLQAEEEVLPPEEQAEGKELLRAPRLERKEKKEDESSDTEEGKDSEEDSTVTKVFEGKDPIELATKVNYWLNQRQHSHYEHINTVITVNLKDRKVQTKEPLWSTIEQRESALLLVLFANRHEDPLHCFLACLPKELVVLILGFLPPLVPKWVATTATHDSLHIYNNGRTVASTETFDNFASILTSVTRKPGQSMSWYFRFDKTENGNMAFGLLPSTTLLEKNYRHSIGWEKNYGWSFMTFKGYGKKRFETDREWANPWPCPENGDVIGMHLNKQNELSYSKNGVSLGVAFTNINVDVVGGISFGTAFQTITLVSGPTSSTPTLDPASPSNELMSSISLFASTTAGDESMMEGL
ncbi:hypothetical protein QOT17_006628 [Balamuthia mandrillaris]